MSWFSSTSKIAYGQNDQIPQEPKSIQQIESQVAMNIQSIQKFYNLNSQKNLINLIIDKKQSEKLFSTTEGNINNQNSKEQKRILFFAQKYTYQALVEKFPKPKSGTNELLLKILQKKMEKGVITSHQTRKNIWLLASGAKFNMINNKQIYQGLLAYDNYPKYFERSITQDLHRTVNKNTSLCVEQDIAKLNNVLTAFSRRNPFIGYCQGLNFIAFFLLTMQFSEEEAFFILSTMLQSIIPMDYYTNMIGVVCDQQIFINILKILKPHIVNKFNQVGLDPSILSIQWFVCLFTSSLPFYLVKIVWDRLLVQGTRAFIKTGLIILSYFEDSIMQTTQFHEIIMILEKGTKNLQISQTVFNAQFQKYYIDKKGLKLARNLYRQYHIKQKLSEKVITRKGKNPQTKCDLKWPICTVKLQRLKKQRQQIDVWIYRSENSPKILHDYLTNKPSNFEKKINISGTFISSGSGFKSKKKTESQTYINTQIVIVADFNTEQITRIEINQAAAAVQQDHKKGHKMEKTQNQEVIPPVIQNKIKFGDLIMGRMQHICKKQVIQLQKVKKHKKSDIKFLSMILEDSEDINNIKIDQKRSETYKKIQKAGSVYEQQVSQNKKDGQNISQQVEQKKQFQRQERQLLARSRTINFYNQFSEKNKELSQIMAGVDIFNQNGVQELLQEDQESEQLASQQQKNKNKINKKIQVNQKFQ